jgi:hypothetical protein
MRIKLIALSAAWAISYSACGLGSPVFAADEAPATLPEAAAPTTLKGGVQIQVTLNDLRDARLDVSRVRKATANLYDEVTRQEVTMSYNPNVVGSTVIMAPAPRFTGGILPARKKWVEASMSEIAPIIKLFKEDVDAALQMDRQTLVSAGGRQKMDPIRTNIFKLVEDSFGTYKQLETLTSSGSYDNNAIASASKTLDGQMKQLDKSLKDGLKLLQQEAKLAKKNAKSA